MPSALWFAAPLLALLAATPLSSAEQKQLFQWSALIGKGSNEAMRALSEVADCGAIDALTTRVPIISRDTIVRRVLDRPISGTRLSGEPFEHDSVNISVVQCGIAKSAVVRAYFFDDDVFRINIRYFLCDHQIRGASCVLDEIGEKRYDVLMYEGIRNKGSYSASGYPPDTTTYYENYVDYLSEPTTQQILSESDCDRPPNINGAQLRYRCLVDVNLDGDSWHSAAMFELFETAIFGERLLGRLAMKQTFVSVRLEQAALDAYTKEMQELVDEEIARLLAREGEQDRRDHEIDSLLGGGGQ